MVNPTDSLQDPPRLSPSLDPPGAARAVTSIGNADWRPIGVKPQTTSPGVQVLP